MNILYFSGITIIIFLCSLMIIYRVKQELERKYTNLHNELLEIKSLLKKQKSQNNKT
jgi:hypothetical protein